MGSMYAVNRWIGQVGGFCWPVTLAPHNNFKYINGLAAAMSASGAKGRRFESCRARQIVSASGRTIRLVFLGTSPYPLSCEHIRDLATLPASGLGNELALWLALRTRTQPS